MEQKNNELSISLKCMKEELEQTREGMNHVNMENEKQIRRRIETKEK